MQKISLEQAEGHLAEIIEKLPPGAEIVLTRDDEPAATIRIMTAFQPRAENAQRDIPGKLYLRTIVVAQAQERLGEIVDEAAQSECAEIALTGNGKLIAAAFAPSAPTRAAPRRHAERKCAVHRARFR